MESNQGSQKSLQARISTGSFDLNDWLGGGYEQDVVTMIVGSAGSGKSNFALLAACSVAREQKVVFIDTEGSFSLERVRQIVGEAHYEKVLGNIFILEVMSFEEQHRAFDQLQSHVKDEGIGLIVVDSMAMHYRLALGEAASSEDEDAVQVINQRLARQMRSLVEIARKRKVPVLITNQVYSNFLSQDDILNGVVKTTNIVGGDLFQYWSKCIIELSKNGRTRRAQLLKHRSLSAKDLYFEIRNAGVFKRSGLF